MRDELRHRIAAYLAEHRVGQLCTSGTLGAWAIPVRYRSSGLEIDCALPRWADVAYYLEQDPRVLLLITDCDSEALRWLEYRANAQVLSSPEWDGLLPDGQLPIPPDELLLAVRLMPRRIDLLDERAGWGSRDTLDL